jgi:mannose-6-phosphate isomerase-like protein (cupin superfamily)
MGDYRTVGADSAEHYRWGEGCDGWHLVKDGRLSVIEEEMPAQAAEVGHSHRRSQQFFYVLAGEAELEIEGRRVRLLRGQGIHVPPGTRHQMRNISRAPVRFLVISEPPSHGDRVPCTARPEKSV